MKKFNYFLPLFISCLIFISFRYMNDKPNGTSENKSSQHEIFAVTSRQLNANNISAWFRTNGSFNRDPATGNSGFEWPKGSGKYARFASGIWVGCKSGNDTLTAVAEYQYDYLPGYVDDAGLPQGNDNPLYRIYSITRGNTTDPDYLNWPVNQGAYTTPSGTPFFLGTQTMFYSYTDAYPHSSGQTSLLSLKAQILQTNWCYADAGLEDAEFIEFKIINRSNSPWADTYIAFWTDDDLGDGSDDAIGCDTLRNLGFTYNITDSDPQYGAAPPAVGTKLLRSPVIFTGNNNDTAKYYNPPGSQNLVIKVGYKFTEMKIFNTYNNGSPQPSDPNSNVETYRVLEGKWKFGDSWVNPVNGHTTTKAYSGDPVSGTGWVMTGGNDRRYLQSFGPFNMNPGDTQSVIIAQLIARGSSNLNSIRDLRTLSDHVQTVYDNNFQSVLAVNNISSEIPDYFTLRQNYPNPFNPATNLEFGIANLGFVSLKVYDALGKEIKTLVNEMKSPGTYRVDFDGNGLASGIYFYKLSTDVFSDTKRMILLK
ncbi:MAG: T9SS type A sorting domain-containing protein [Ignavibacteria bacterium]|nr:T9SS type A sorting domain-containing protein [Ignavibacteria bacterium]